jgi:hypothetical protein
MKAFWVFVLVVGLFVAAFLRWKWKDDGKKPAAPKAVPVAAGSGAPPIAPEPVAPSAVQPAPAPAPAPAPEPEKPRIPGGTFVAAATTDWFALGADHVFWCEREIKAVPKKGGDEEMLGECNSHDLHAAGKGVVFSHEDSIWESTPGESIKKVTMADSIIFAADEDHVYFVVPGFDDNPDQGAYRIRRSGGMAEKIHVGRKSEHLGIALDADTIFISGFFTGTLVKRAKKGGKVTQVFAGQKGISEVVTDGDYIYWQVEDPREVRRRKKTGGKIEVVIGDVDQGKFDVHDGTVYALTGQKNERDLVAVKPDLSTKVIAENIAGSRVFADRDGIFVYVDGTGIYSLPIQN